VAFDLSKIGVKKNIPKVNFTDHTGLFVAEGKFGKTTTASLFPNAVIVPFEDGVKGQVANVVENMNEWEDFIEFVDNLEEHREEIGDDIKTIVFDTVNKAYELCEPYTLKQLSIMDGKRYRKPNDVPHGQFYPARDKYFTQQIDRILKMGFAILFLSHSKVKTINPKNGESYDVYSSTMPDRLEAIIYPLVDYIIFGERRIVDDGKGNKVPKRALVVKGNDMTVAGGRVRLHEDILFDTEEEAMEKFQALFEEEIKEKLRKAGITTDLETLKKQQSEQKKEQVREYIEHTKKAQHDPQELKNKITEKFNELNSEQKKEIVAKFKEQLGKVDYTKVDDVETLKKYLAIVSE
jgi:uncharacterized protein (UPF0335 family)